MEIGNTENGGMTEPENGNTENGGMTEPENGNRDLSHVCEVVTCGTDDGLLLGMEICAYDSTGMRLDCDEEILTASSLELVSEHGGLETQPRPSNSAQQHEGDLTPSAPRLDPTPPLQPDNLTLCDPQKELTPSVQEDGEQLSEDESLEESSQISQSDSAYCLSQESSVASVVETTEGLSSDVAMAEDDGESWSAREEVGGASDVTSGEEGRRRRRRRRGRGRRRWGTSLRRKAMNKVRLKWNHFCSFFIHTFKYDVTLYYVLCEIDCYFSLDL